MAAAAEADVEAAAAAEADEGARHESAFEVCSAFEPLARLERRSPTLDGAVPLRVAQACVPLLEGNAAGLQIVLARRLVVRARLGKRSFEATPAFEAVDRAHRAAAPLLAARGYLGDVWQRRLARSWWWTERGLFRVWTGLLVRPASGIWLRVSGTKNRGVFGLRLRTSFVGDEAAAGPGWTPLVIDLEEPADGTRLDGEIATVLPVAPGIRFRDADANAANELVRAHAAFYDARYFAAKKGEITRKYRRHVARERGGEPAARRADAGAVAEIVHLAGPRPEIVDVDRVVGPASTTPAPSLSGDAVTVARFAHAVSLRAHWDGNTLDVVPDRAALEDGGRSVRDALAHVAGEGFARDHEGAVLYLTKYVTPHPHGEPHFFVKPWAFVRTPPGCSSLVEGVSGDGHEILRGVVWTDRFHAVPAVFHATGTRPFRVRTGAPMLEVVPVRRSLLAAGFVTRSET